MQVCLQRSDNRLALPHHGASFSSQDTDDARDIHEYILEEESSEGSSSSEMSEEDDDLYNLLLRKGKLKQNQQQETPHNNSYTLLDLGKPATGEKSNCGNTNSSNSKLSAAGAAATAEDDATVSCTESFSTLHDSWNVHVSGDDVFQGSLSSLLNNSVGGDMPLVSPMLNSPLKKKRLGKSMAQQQQQQQQSPCPASPATCLELLGSPVKKAPRRRGSWSLQNQHPLAPTPHLGKVDEEEEGQEDESSSSLSPAAVSKNAVAASAATKTRKRRTKRVRFGSVSIRTHRVILDTVGGYGRNGYGLACPLTLDWASGEHIQVHENAYACPSYFCNVPLQPLSLDERRWRLAVLHNQSLEQLRQQEERSLLLQARALVLDMNKRQRAWSMMLPNKQSCSDGRILDHRYPCDWASSRDESTAKSDPAPRRPRNDFLQVIEWKRNVSPGASGPSDVDAATKDFQPLSWFSPVTDVTAPESEDEDEHCRVVEDVKQTWNPILDFKQLLRESVASLHDYYLGDEDVEHAAEQEREEWKPIDLQEVFHDSTVALNGDSPNYRDYDIEEPQDERQEENWKIPQPFFNFRQLLHVSTASLDLCEGEEEDDEEKEESSAAEEEHEDWKKLLKAKVGELPLLGNDENDMDDDEDEETSEQEIDDEPDEWKPAPMLDLKQMLDKNNRSDNNRNTEDDDDDDDDDDNDDDEDDAYDAVSESEWKPEPMFDMKTLLIKNVDVDGITNQAFEVTPQDCRPDKIPFKLFQPMPLLDLRDLLFGNDDGDPVEGSIDDDESSSHEDESFDKIQIPEFKPKAMLDLKAMLGELKLQKPSKLDESEEVVLEAVDVVGVEAEEEWKPKAFLNLDDFLSKEQQKKEEAKAQSSNKGKNTGRTPLKRHVGTRALRGFDHCGLSPGEGATSIVR